jgi:hypothetical protein
MDDHRRERRKWMSVNRWVANSGHAAYKERAGLIVIGVIAVLSAIVSGLIGASPFESIVQWMSAKPSGVIRLMYMLDIISRSNSGLVAEQLARIASR